MHAVGEVDRRGDLRHVDDVAVRGEHVDPIRRHIARQPFAEIPDIANLLLPLEHLAQPGDLLFVTPALGVGVHPLVAPVRADAELRLLVHGEGTYLDLEHLVLGADHRGMQRLVAVLLGVGDIVVEFVGHMMPARMHDTEGGVAVGDFGHQNAHRAHVVDLGEIDALALHLAPDRVDMLGATVQVISQYPLAFEQRFQRMHDILDITVSIQPLLRQLLGDRLVFGLVQVAEGQILQLPLDLADAQPMGQRRIDIEYFARHA